ncbi:MAG: alpha/beta fold hydrolase [Proteobacteria bacterium]|nr:alpha/beta fold hydrolase [Pseudomonadota bacterium]
MYRLFPLVLALSACVKAVPPSMHPAEVVRVQTEDNWTLDLRHYPGDGPPVLLVHGMGANHYNWDYTEEVSLATTLGADGWDVWIPELRGDPGSEAPSKRARRNFSFDDHAVFDLPAHVDTVLSETGEAQLYWVGHSMGGILLYTGMRDYPDKIAGGVAVCSPVTLEHPNGLHKLARGFGWAVGGRGLLRQSGAARAFGWMGRSFPMWGVLGNRKNLDWDIGKGLAKHALVDLPRPMAKQAIGWMRSREVGEIDGTPWVPEQSDVPVLILGGAADRIVPEANVAPACGIFSDCTYRVLGTEGGFAVDYGHIDPVLTRQGASEVFPLIADWLEQASEATAAD